MPPQYSSTGSGPYGHVSVLLDEVIEALDPQPGEDFVDCTLGAGGHSAAILEKTGPGGRLLGLDADPMALAISSERLRSFAPRAVLVHSNFARLTQEAQSHGFSRVGGVLIDLGLSSVLLERSTRGFSFHRDEPLDMRFDPSEGRTASDIVNTSSLEQLAQMLRKYGEEPRARAVARAILRARATRPISSTKELAEIVGPVAAQSARIHSATRTFQALRIATNSELEVLSVALHDAVDLLLPGGRLAVISFHSLEDRIVKHLFLSEQRGCVCPPKLPVCVCGRKPRLRVLTKKPIEPSKSEVARNPRSRSAKLRVAERMEDA